MSASRGGHRYKAHLQIRRKPDRDKDRRCAIDRRIDDAEMLPAHAAFMDRESLFAQGLLIRHGAERISFCRTRFHMRIRLGLCEFGLLQRSLPLENGFEREVEYPGHYAAAKPIPAQSKKKCVLSIWLKKLPM